ncbi:uncharacterized protein ASCRUDRAFT_61376 [Ascoidea rubescens DSM 1968]|uniref:NADH dehydrogenase [ubiquinone] 1 alpha subcomplex subunit 13 n=1 Tax=Ascoidea rubescens DSM 1968 TaxID=1344418 RepID=A0A1D2VBR5_9ASCO|nr:hypothetical protein ASCRUDRAFT_61376 [Ascoidea rubescens DSM 1968]ODV59055.1 hypothetical protein ASCRUDRAFT_61376 [Ascoidea rubescens DSM 1968]
MPTVQDLPPVGGYDPIQWKRHLPSRGFRPKIYFLGLVLFMSYGFYKSCLAIRERNELKREKNWARIYLSPLLIAEHDRNLIRKHLADRSKESIIMKNITGWDVDENVYNDGRFRIPTYSFADYKDE